jgi:hypothetical protein
LYNAAQKRMVETKTDFCLYYGIGYLKQEAQGQDLYQKITPFFSEAIISQNGTCINAPTINKLLHLAKFCVGQGGYVADHVPYPDQKLAVDGIPVFGKLAKLGGIYMTCTGPGEDVLSSKI